jgi:hypothetical protein
MARQSFAPHRPILSWRRRQEKTACPGQFGAGNDSESLQIALEYLRISAMKAWQIFAAGVVVLVAALLLPAYEPALAGLAAVVMVAVVVAGFLFRPRQDVFYLRTTLLVSEPDYPLSVEHDRIAVRVELARLWLLFLPTMAAVGFLLVTFSQGTTWRFSLLDRFWEASSYPIFLGFRAFQVVVVGLVSTWVSERWVLRDADACSADSVSMMAGRLVYSFRDHSGEYYGGDGFPFALVRSLQLARIVFYRASKPELNKIASGCLFHRPVIVGRGVPDLDEATVAMHSVKAQPASQPLEVRDQP